MSHLIVGGTTEKRKLRAESMAHNQFYASSFDTIIIGEAEGGISSSIGIGEVRYLRHQLNLKPYNSALKVAILHPAELLTIEAQNALLKILEEPNETSVLILTAPRSDFLLPTIVSRCQIIKLSAEPDIILSKEESDALYFILNTLCQAGAGERLKIAAQISKEKEEIKDWLMKLLIVLREILIKPSVASASRPRLLINPTQTIKIIRNLEYSLSLFDQNVNPRLVLEIFLLDFSSIRN